MEDFNIKLLKKVLSIQTYYADDSDMLNYIKKFLGSIKVPYEEDTFGNIYVTKGKPKKYYPCIVSHTDTVISKVKSFKVVEIDNVLVGFNTDTYAQHGIGGDDKVGVFMCLQAIKDVDNIKAVFFRQEESGCKGSNYSITNKKEFYKDCSYIIQCDRFGNQDFITEASGVTISSKEFVKDCMPLIKKHHYKTASGLSTDVATLARNGVGVSCVNLSCGYYDHHTNREIVSIEDATDCYKIVLDLINTLGETHYPHIYKSPVYKNRSKNTTYYSSSWQYPDSKEDILDKYDIVNEPNSEYSYFKKVGTSALDIYTLSKKEPVLIKGKSNCCNTDDSTYIRPKNNSIFCIECGKSFDKVKEREAYANISITSDNEKFVFSSMERYWIKKSKSSFVTTYYSYIRK